MRHRKKLRLEKYDYSSEGAYFVTICVKDRECMFGQVVDGRMQLTSIGTMADLYWNLIPKFYSNILLDEYVIMPNHLHGIIFINTNVEAINNRLHGQLSRIIKSYKQKVTKEARAQGQFFQWQRSFYDHIIRDNTDLNVIRKYVMNNVLTWELDENNQDNNL